MWGGVVFMGLVVTGCGRFGFDLSSMTDGRLADGLHDAPPDIDTTTHLCADVGGRACTASEICIVKTVPTVDVSSCCPSNRCLNRGGKTVLPVAPRTGGVTIDGLLTDWAGVASVPITHVTHGTPTAADFTAKLSAQWDSTGLYLLFQMSDDVCRPQDSVPPLTTAYNDDSVEVYLAMDPRTLTSASYGPGQWWTWVPQTCGATAAICGIAPPAAPLTSHLTSWIRPPPTNFSVPGPNLVATYGKSGNTNCNWWVELEVSWPNGFPTPIAGDVLGFDAAANDDDTGVRRNQLVWNDTTGNIYQDARLLGLLQLLP